MNATSKYAACGLSDEKVASLDACNAAYAKWWAGNKGLGWSAEIDPFVLRIAFNGGWYFCSERVAQGIEARSDTTGTGVAEGESPVAKPCAQGEA